MKRILFSIITMVGILMVATLAYSAEYDAERVAQAVGVQFSHYQGDIYYASCKDGVTTAEFRGQYRADPTSYSLTYLVLNDRVLVDVSRGGAPFAGFPYPEEGQVCNFSLGVQAYGKQTGRFLAYGSSGKAFLALGEPILVPALEIAYVPEFVPYKLPAGYDPDQVRLVLYQNGQLVSRTPYNRDLSGFQIYMNPLIPGVFDVVDLASQTDIIRGQSVDALRPGGTENRFSALNIRLPGGVQQISFNTWTSIDGVRFAGKVDRCPDGGDSCDKKIAVPAQVFLINLGGDGMFVGVSEALTNPRIEVRRWVDRGIMPVVAATNDRNLAAYSSEQVVVVTITGTPPPEGGFSVYFQRISQGGGGGKG